MRSLAPRVAAKATSPSAAPARRKFCAAAMPAAEAEAAKAAEHTGLKWLLVEGQVDSGMWQGAALLGAVVAGVQLASEKQRETAINALLGGYRACGLTADKISDRQLIEDYVRKNAAAAVNVVMASPTFYFLFAKMHGQSLAVSSVRAFTGARARRAARRPPSAVRPPRAAASLRAPRSRAGTLRIVPFMGFFYGAFALCCPFVTAALVDRGQTYSEANGNAGVAVMLSGFVFVEAIVELRGCGVTFGQMTASSFLIFVPALIGRLATGVLTQQQKVGVESESVLPADWQEGPTWQQHTYMTFEMLHLDKDFFTTAAGTSVFQHILNATTWVLLTQGRTATFGSIFKFMLGGMNGTVLSGAAQFGKTLILRSLFGWVWNFCSSQELDMPAFDTVLKGLPPNPAT